MGRYCWMICNAVEVRHHCCSVLIMEWGTTTVDIMRMLVSCASVLLEMYVLLEEMPHQEEWRSATMASGAQCVMTFGTRMMLELSADNLDSHSQVR